MPKATTSRKPLPKQSVCSETHKKRAVCNICHTPCVTNVTRPMLQMSHRACYKCHTRHTSELIYGQPKQAYKANRNLRRRQLLVSGKMFRPIMNKHTGDFYLRQLSQRKKRICFLLCHTSGRCPQRSERHTNYAFNASFSTTMKSSMSEG